MPQALLEGEFPHPVLPQSCRVCMAKRMRGDPGFANTQPFTVAFKELDKCMVAERLIAPFSTTTHQEDKGAIRLLGTLVHHVRIECLKSFLLQQIDHPFGP